MLLDEASVTGTANIARQFLQKVQLQFTTQHGTIFCNSSKMLANGEQILLSRFKLVDDNRSKFYGCEHRILPDMIEIGSWIGLACYDEKYTIKE
jgi:UDP-N-acetylglucosamine 1-carboxyvinyltransferase